MCFPAIGAAIAGYGSVAAATKAGASVIGLGLLGAGTVASVASPLVSYAGQRQQAKAQAKYQAQAAAAERQRFLQEQTAIRIQEAQKQKAAGEELADIARRTEGALGTATAIAANRGITGLSLEALRDDITRQAGGVQFRIAQQQGMGEVATAMALEQAGFATTQRQVGIAKPISRPSLTLAGLQSLSGGVQAYTAGRSYRASLEA
jgi:hypothetical protein